MRFWHVVASVCFAIVLTACHLEVRAASLFFPQYDSNSNEINNPLTTNANLSGIYTAAGIGFKPHVLPDPGDPNSPFFPFTVPNPASLTVTSGGKIPVLSVIVANASTVTLNGTGQIGGNVDIYDTSSFNLSGEAMLGFHPGTAALFAHDSSKVTVSGGTIAGGLVAYDQSNVTMSGGQVNGIFADGGTINVTGGTVVSGYEANGGILNVSVTPTYLFGGSGVTAFNGAQVSFAGGGTLGDAQANNKSVMTLTGVTTFGTVAAADHSVIHYVGGIAGNLFATNDSHIDVDTFNGPANIPGTVDCDSSLIGIGSGTVGFLKARGTQSTLLLGDGTVLGTVTSFDSGHATVGAGTIGGFVDASDKSLITLGLGSSLLTVSSSVTASDSARIDIVNAMIESDATARGSSTITLSTATATGSLTTNDSSAAVMSGSHVGGSVVMNGMSQVTVEGGGIGGNVSANNSSFFSLLSGNVDGSVNVANSARAVLIGGDIAESVTSLNGGTISIADAVVVEGDVVARQQSTITIGGADIFGAIRAFDTAHIFLNGTLLPNSKPQAMAAASDGIRASLAPPDGSAFPPIFLNDNSTLEFDGHRLTAALLDPLNGGGAYSEYEISGYFADGSPIPSGLDLFVANGSTASFQLVEAVPEPASALLMVIAAVGLIGLQKNRCRRSA